MTYNVSSGTLNRTIPYLLAYLLTANEVEAAHNACTVCCACYLSRFISLKCLFVLRV